MQWLLVYSSNCNWVNHIHKFSLPMSSLNRSISNCLVPTMLISDGWLFHPLMSTVEIFCVLCMCDCLLQHWTMLTDTSFAWQYLIHSCWIQLQYWHHVWSLFIIVTTIVIVNILAYLLTKKVQNITIML